MRKNDLLFYGCSIRFESYWNKENYDDKYFDIWYIFHEMLILNENKLVIKST